MTYKAFILLAIVSLVIFLATQDAKAQWWNPFPQQPQQTERIYDHYRGGIDREGFAYINSLGGGQDENGYYRQPVTVQQAWGSDVPDGRYGYRAQWDQQIHILYDVRNGEIVRQDYHFNLPQRREP